MSKAIQRRRGTTAEHSTFTGLLGEVTVDTTKKTLIVHDASTAGGTPLAKESALAGKADLVHANRHYPGGADPVNSNAYHGFVNRTDSTLAWTGATPDRTLTITGTYDYYHQGTKVSVSTSKAAQITNTAGLWYFSFNAGGTLVAGQAFPSMDTTVIVAIVYWNGTSGLLYDERHNYTRNKSWHIWAHSTIGCRYGSGIDLTFVAAAGTSTFATTEGTIYDEDIAFTCNASAAGINWYRTGASAYTFDPVPTTTPFKWNGTTSRVQYVNTSYALADCATNRYVNVWVYACNCTARPIMFVSDTIATTYPSAANARASAPPNLSAMGLSPEIKLLYRLVVRGDGEIQTAVTADDYRNSSALPAGGTASTTAGSVAFIPTTGVTSTNVQGAIEELEADILSVSGASYASTAETTTGTEIAKSVTPAGLAAHEKTVNPAISTTAGNTGTLTFLLSWISKMVKAITGKTNWYDTPSVSLETIAGQKVGFCLSVMPAVGLVSPTFVAPQAMTIQGIVITSRTTAGAAQAPSASTNAVLYKGTSSFDSRAFTTATTTITGLSLAVAANDELNLRLSANNTSGGITSVTYTVIRA